jgi:tetraacyldisaccharide 4'-kinase
MRLSVRRDARFDVLYPMGTRRHWPGDPAEPPLGLLTVPVSRLYVAASAQVRTAALRRRSKASHGAVVISIGNLEMGGNGKTPLAIHIIHRLAARGYRPVYVSRGFRSAAERSGLVSVVNWEGLPSAPSTAAGLRYVRSDGPGLSRAIGDEGALVAARCPAAPLFISRDRRRAVSAALAVAAPTHVILDDAFQTWGVPRDVDIVMLDAERPLGNGRVVPAGSLREEPSALARADMIGVNGYRSREDLDRVAASVERAAGRAIPMFGVSRSISFLDAASGARSDAPAGPVVSLSALARPQGFDRALVDNGLDLVLSLRYPDHHAYGSGDLRRIGDLCRERGACIVTTEKDWVKLRDQDLPFDGACIARLDVAVEPESVLAEIERPRKRSAAVNERSRSNGLV